VALPLRGQRTPGVGRSASINAWAISTLRSCAQLISARRGHRQCPPVTRMRAFHAERCTVRRLVFPESCSRYSATIRCWPFLPVSVMLVVFGVSEVSVRLAMIWPPQAPETLGVFRIATVRPKR
jgi:hypothetical protein